MKKILSIVLSLTIIITILTGCSGQNKPSINVYNWGQYISNGEDDTLNVIKEFEKQYGIKVNYTTYATNEELYTKLKAGAGDYDVIIPSDYMISKLIEEDMLEQLNYDNIPNANNLMDKFKTTDYDPNNKHSIPYTWGTVGLVYNTTMVDGKIDSWNALFDPKYKNNILMFDNSRDAFGIGSKLLGFSQNTTDKNQLYKISQKLKEEKPLVQSYVMDQIFDKMENDEAAIAPYYAGDAVNMMANNKNLAYAFPKEGTNLFIDAMCIPKGSKNKDNAEKFINFMCEIKIGKSNIEYIQYSTPLQSVFDELPEEVKNNEIIYPTDEQLANTESFINLPKDINELIQTLWEQIKLS